MSFLSPYTALIAAAASIPLLLLLYFLKLRRTEHTIPSTLLWRKAVQDLRVNAPFQKLRKNILLLLQMLLLIAVLVALAKPVMNFVRKPERNVVLVIDQSASMKTIEEDGRPRIEHAKQAATEFIDNLGGGSKAMIIGFSDRAEVVTAFTNDLRRLKNGIDGIEATDGLSRIGEALQLAVAYSSSFVEGADDPGFIPDSVQTADIELFGDGRITDAAEEFITRAEMIHHQIGAVSDNVGITAFGVRRAIDQPGIVSVFATVQNFGPTAVTTDASLFLDDRLLDVVPVELGPTDIKTSTQPANTRDTDDSQSGRNIVFKFSHEAGGVLRIKLSRDDALPLDNEVHAPLDPPRAMRVLIVADREPVIRTLEWTFGYALQIDDVRVLSTEGYEAAAEEEIAIEGRSAYDLVVIDKHDTDRLPPGNYVFFNGVPKVDGVEIGDDINEYFFVTWREAHPLLRYVELETVQVAKWRRLTLPDHAARLIEGENSVVTALITDPGHRYLINAFDLLDTDFTTDVAFPIFIQNTIDYLAGGDVETQRRMIAPGETITVQVPAGASEMTVTMPDQTKAEVDVEGRLNSTFGNTRSVGIYNIKFDDPKESTETYCVNILDEVESLIAPNNELSLSGTRIETVSGETEVNDPVWPYAVAAALVFLMIEWWVYNRRVMI